MPRPNILLIHCHDLGRHLGCYGVSTVCSPNLDRLASQGITATGMFAAAPQCSPSRAALFTGRWPHANGVMGLTHGSFGWDLDTGERHLASLLTDAGYHTELLGVHHESRTGGSDTAIGERLGFARVQTGGLADTVAERGTAALTQAAASEQPFYLQVGFAEPHRMPGDRDPDGVMGFLGNHIEPDTRQGITVPPYLVDDHDARAELAELQGSIRHMDAAVGRILTELDRLGLTDDTITIFTTDHGLALPRAKCSLYDPGLEIAFLARWPGGGWSGGTTYPGLVSNVNVVPTLLDAVGLAAGTPHPLHGVSFAAALAGGQRPANTEPADSGPVFAEMTYHDYYDPRRCIRTDEWKLIANFSSAPGFMDPSQSWRRRCRPKQPSYPHSAYHPSLELYRLRDDPSERHDVADVASHADVCHELIAQLGAWMTITGDPLLQSAVTSPRHRQTLDRIAASPA